MQRILGVDIGTYSIKVAEIERSFKAFELVSFYEHPILYHEAYSTDEAITATLEKMADDYSLREGLVYTALPGDRSATHLVDLPFGNPKKVDQTIEFEIEDYVPFALDDIQIDYHIVKSSKTDSTCLMSYARKSDMVKFLNTFSAADLEPRFVGCEAVELGSVMKLGIIQPEGAYGILDLGHSKSNLTIFIGSELYFARTISVGGLHLTRAIAEKLQVPMAEAEKLKIEIGQVAAEAHDDMTRKVSEAMTQVLEELLIQVKQTFVNFQDNQDQVVQALYLCGGTSRLSGIDHFFSYELRKNVSYLDCLDFPFNKLSESEWCRPIIPIALALAYRGAGNAKLPEIQFRRGEFTYRGDIDTLSRVSKQVAILAGIVMVFAALSFTVNYFALNSKIKDLKKSVAGVAGKSLPETPPRMLESPDSVLSIINGKILEITERQDSLAEKLTLSYLNALLEIAKNLPPREELKLDIDELNIGGDRIRMEGRAYGTGSVQKIKDAIVKSPLFKNVSTGNIRKVKDDAWKFDLTLQIKLSEDEESEVAEEVEGGH